MEVERLCASLWLFIFSLSTNAFSLSIDGSNRQKPLALSQSRNPIDRRRAFKQSFFGTLCVSAATLVLKPSPALSFGEGPERMVFRQKPTAPVGALLPAVQQRLLLEAALEFAKQRDTEKLRSILPPLDENDSISHTGGSQNARILKRYNPAKVLKGNVVRAAMNLYQTNLNYNDLLANPNEAFSITDPDWKKSYIRANDGLPDLKKVIGADLDLRNLLRNQVQLQMDDAAAELYRSDCDSQELLGILQEAARNFDLWLDRVRVGDVRDALQAAFGGEAVPVYESYMAGFLPTTPTTTTR